MNRRLRRLLTGGLLGAAASFMMGRRKQGARGNRRNDRQLMGPMFLSFLNTIRKAGWWQKFFPLKRRIR